MFLEMVKLLNLLVNKHRWTKGGGVKWNIFSRGDANSNVINCTLTITDVTFRQKGNPPKYLQ